MKSRSKDWSIVENMYGGGNTGKNHKAHQANRGNSGSKDCGPRAIFCIVINKRQEQQDDRYCMRQEYFLEAFCNFLQNGNMGRAVDPRWNRGKNGRKNLGFKR